MSEENLVPTIEPTFQGVCECKPSDRDPGRFSYNITYRCGKVPIVKSIMKATNKFHYIFRDESVTYEASRPLKFTTSQSKLKLL
jgi:hypothetical protein